MANYHLNWPNLSSLEEKYVLEALKSEWLSADGKHTKQFEKKFAAYVGVNHCLAVQSGTAALHLAMRALGVGPRDTVLIPNFSCGASISSVKQCGAVPVVMDVDPDSYALDATRLEAAIKKYQPKALQLVHVYGFPARDTILIRELCTHYGVFLVEDCSEALGATFGDQMIGQFGDISIFSIRSEKMIGVGEGGVIVTNSPWLHERILLLASRSAPFRGSDSPYWSKYFYDGEGFNYLLPHLLGAVAHAQIERFHEEILPAKQRVGRIYQKLFANIPGTIIQKEAPGTTSAFWLNSILFDKLHETEVKKLANFLISEGVELRPGFWPLSDMSAFQPEVYQTQEIGYQLFKKLLVLPSAYFLKENDVAAIKELITSFLEQNTQEA